MTTRITATEAARNLSDLLNRASYRDESFLITRGGEEVGRLDPPGPRRRKTVRELLDDLKHRGFPDPDFGRDLSEIQAEQPLVEEAPWER